MEDKKIVSNETEGEFKKRMERAVNDGYLCIAMSMGMQTGLLQKMIVMDTPMTCQEIADKSNMKERYVREWLGAMVMSNVVSYDTVDKVYWLPKEHRCIMDLEGFAMCAQSLSTMFFDVAECFKTGGPSGIPHDKYAAFDAILTKIHGPLFKNELKTDFLPSVPKILNKLESGIAVLDIGCGAGASTIEFAKQFPKSQIYGLDLSADGIEMAKADAHAADLTNTVFVCQDAHSLPSDWTGKFGYVFAHMMIHDMIDPPKVLKEIRRVLSPGGVLSVLEPTVESKLEDNIHDMDHASVLFTISTMYCVPTTLCKGKGEAMGAMMGKENIKKMLEDAGYKVSVTEVLSAFHYFCTL